MQAVQGAPPAGGAWPGTGTGPRLPSVALTQGSACTTAAEGLLVA